MTIMVYIDNDNINYMKYKDILETIKSKDTLYKIFCNEYDYSKIDDISKILHKFIINKNNKEDGEILLLSVSIVVENKVRGEVAGHIEDIVVDTEVRGKMIGVSLIKELVKVAKRKGCYRVTLFCKESLINFYSRNGFEVNNVVMKKYL